MNFRTQVELPEKETEILHSDRIMLFGSCFADNIGNLLAAHKFRCDVNPFGTLYNPLSVAEALRRIDSGWRCREADLLSSGGQWHSLMHHSAFSASSADECRERINRRMEWAAEEWPRIDWLILTWGTAWVYFWNETGEVVGNCHKLPDRLFGRRMLMVDEIVETYVGLLDRVRRTNPQVKVLITVSPIRHVKDGLHGNQLSKSTLLLAAEALRQRCESCFYFPAYEILMDDLRDYRFYAADMVHPSSVAVAYVWECFVQTYFSRQTRQIMQEWEEIERALNHRPFDANSERYRHFLTQIVLKINRMKEKFPYFEVQKELEQCQTRLKV